MSAEPKGVFSTDDSYRGPVTGWGLQATGSDEAGRAFVSISLWLGMPLKTAIRKARAGLLEQRHQIDQLVGFEVDDLPPAGPCLVFERHGASAVPPSAVKPRGLAEVVLGDLDLARPLSSLFPDPGADLPGFRKGKRIVGLDEAYRATEGLESMEERVRFLDTRTIYKVPRGKLIATPADVYDDDPEGVETRWFSVLIEPQRIEAQDRGRARVVLVSAGRASSLLDSVNEVTDAAARAWDVNNREVSTRVFGPILPLPMTGSTLVDLIDPGA